MPEREPISITFTPVRDSKRMVRYVPQDDDRWKRTTYEWTGCAWRQEGAEMVDALDVETGGTLTTVA